MNKLDAVAGVIIAGFIIASIANGKGRSLKAEILADSGFLPWIGAAIIMYVIYQRGGEYGKLIAGLVFVAVLLGINWQVASQSIKTIGK